MILFPGLPDEGFTDLYLALFVAFMLAFLADCYTSILLFGQALAPWHLLRHTTAYCLHMYLTHFAILSVLSFNVGVFLAVIAGHVFGRFAAQAFILYRYPNLGGLQVFLAGVCVLFGMLIHYIKSI